jgi:pimeloyl-ACP methyl ester carboxylesterase
MLGTALVLSALGLVPGSASAARFRPCGPDVLCGRVVVPLDPSGTVKGALSLHVEKMRTVGAARGGALIALAGGPGQAATPLLTDFRIALDPALHGRDLVVFDQRGTGRSGELVCPGIGSHQLPDLGLGRCAQRIGMRRGFFSTYQSVSDLEAVRRAIGVEKISIYGVSYGTKVALDYATRFPQHVDRLVLDSLVMPDALDPYALSTFAAVPRVLGQTCAANACTGITSDPVGDLSKLIDELVGQAVTGNVYNGKGKRRRARLRRSGILEVLIEGDFDPTLRADFPAAVRAALNGDAAPMLRLAAAVRGAENLSEPGDSEALFAATTCEDAALPWDPSTPPAQRASEARQSFNQLPPSTYAPFDQATVFKFSLAPFCATWPEAGSRPPVEQGPPPAVPALLISGDEDLRTPQEDAIRLAGRLPKATLVKVPGVGHSVLGGDLSGCSLRALRHFFRGEPVGACPAQRALVPPSPVPPTSLRQFPRVRGLPSRVARTLLAAQNTLADAFERSLSALLLSPDGFTIPAQGGLRGGYFDATSTTLRLHAYSWVPGVELTGRVPARGTITVHVGGSAAAHGILRISERGGVRGRLDGHRVAGRFLAAAAGKARAKAARLRTHRFEPFSDTVLRPG